jgi:hypothetical protein
MNESSVNGLQRRRSFGDCTKLPSGTSSFTHSTTKSADSRRRLLDRFTEVCVAGSQTTQSGYVQMMIHNGPNPSAELKLRNNGNCRPGSLMWVAILNCRSFEIPEGDSVGKDSWYHLQITDQE